MQKICFNSRTVKDLLRTCHLKTGIKKKKTGISEKAGLVVICLKNGLESAWSQITEGLECQEEKFRLHCIGGWEPLENIDQGSCWMKLVF